MALEFEDASSVQALLCARLLRLYEAQTQEGRAALLGFLHMSNDSQAVTARFRISRSGRAHLVMMAQPASPD